MFAARAGSIYAPTGLALRRDGLLHAAAHVTGGGFLENISRALADGLGACIRRGSWPEPAVFDLVGREAGLTGDDLFGTFNMRIGMVLVVEPGRADEVLARTRGYRIGTIVTGAGADIE
jgi:phosphoribosylformylglycinamidine cyclo-ligase